MRAQILNASAGSGKTYRLAYKYVRDVVEHPASYRSILAVTFTNKATEEMKSRILKEIHRLAAGMESPYLADLSRELHLPDEVIRRRAKEVRSSILHDYSHFTVLTIDTFFQRILRAFIKELNLELNYNIELDDVPLIAQGTDALIEQITTDNELRQWLGRFVEEQVEEGRSWDIRSGIRELGRELFKETNKDSIAAARSRDQLAAVMEQLKSRCDAETAVLRGIAARIVATVEAAGGSIADFPYGASGFMGWIRRAAADDRSYQEGYGKRLLAACETEKAWGKPKSLSQQLRPTLQPLVQQARACFDGVQRHLKTYGLLRSTYRSFALLGDLYERIKTLCDEQQLMLLSETKYLLSAFVSNNDAPFIYEKVGNRFERFMIDEFQDTSVKEWENFLPLLRNAMAQADEQTDTVLLVGDIKQSIYRWRGSDWRILHTKAAEDLGPENVRITCLGENYRSLPAIVRFNNAVMGRIVADDNEALNTRLTEGVAEGALDRESLAELHDMLANAYSNTAQIPRRKARNEGYISIDRFNEAESPLIGRICEVLDRGFAPSQILILVRGATDGARIAKELLDFKSRNKEPRYRFDIMTQEALQIGSAPVSTFLTAVMRLAINPDDSLRRALYNQYLGHPFDRPCSDEELRFFRSLRLRSPEEAFERIVLQYELQQRPPEIAYLQALHEQIIAFDSRRVADLPLFLAWWEEHGRNSSLSVGESSRTIEITTVHKAKGLEKPVVIIPACTWETDPHAYTARRANIVWAQAAADDEAADLGRVPLRFSAEVGRSGFAATYYRELVYSHIDNINLLYVALTRAAEELHIFLPVKERELSRQVGALVRRAVTVNGDRCRIEAPAKPDEEPAVIEGRYTRTETTERFEFGSCCGPEAKELPADAVTTVTLDRYPTSQPELRLRLPSQRYFEEESEPELSPRNFGILMHRAFAAATSRAEIDEAVGTMLHEGVLDETTAAELRERIGRALADPTVGSWFDGSWEELRNEAEIIVPGAAETRRPDRVMIRGRRAVVVDYKFGEHADAARYGRQIGAYCHLLREMGYDEVAGYLWYVRLGKVVAVE